MEKKLIGNNKKVDIEKCFDDLESKSRDNLIIYEYLINFYLTEIKSKKVANLKRFWRASNKFMHHYIFKRAQYKNKKRFDDIKKYGDKIGWAIIIKAKDFNYHGDYVFKINEIINYMLNFDIKKEEIKLVLRLLIVRLSICANLEGNY